MNKRYKIEATLLLYRFAELVFKVNLKTMAQFLTQNSAQLNTDWRVCNPQPRTPMDRDYHRQKALKYNFTVIIKITFSPHPHLHLIVSLKYNVFYRRTVFHVCKNLCTFIRFVMFQDSETKFDLMLNSSNQKFCTCVSYY
jgi:hypothetical protein